MNIAESYLSALGSGIQQGQQMQQARNESALAPLRQQALEQQIQSSQLGMDATRQSMAFDAETHQIQVKDHLAKMTADERAAAAENLRQNIGLVISADTPEKWDNIASQAAPELVGQFGQREAIVNSLRTTEQQIAAFDAANAPVKPDWVTVDGHMVDRNAPGGPAVVPVAGMEPQGPEWETLPADEAAGYGFQFAQRNVKTGEIRGQKIDGGIEIVSGPNGTTVRTNAKGSDKTPAAIDPKAPEAMIQSIDGILNDPALAWSTGMLSFTQALPGTPMRRVGGRVKQLDGQAFLQAMDGLRGTGQITEVEGTKGTQAIGRLDSAQSEQDYRNALGEIRSILSEAAKRPEGWVSQQKDRQQPLYPAADILAMTPEQISGLGPDALTRIPVTELKGLSDEQWTALESLAK